MRFQVALEGAECLGCNDVDADPPTALIIHRGKQQTLLM